MFENHYMILMHDINKEEEKEDGKKRNSRGKDNDV